MACRFGRVALCEERNKLVWTIFWLVNCGKNFSLFIMYNKNVKILICVLDELGLRNWEFFNSL